MYQLVQICEGDIGGDFRDVFINGVTSFDYAVPRSRCETCDRISSSKRILPISCPPEISEEVYNANNCNYLPSTEELAPFLENWRTAVSKIHPNLELLPGDQFQPLSWSVPSFPVTDLYFTYPREIVRYTVAKLFAEHRFTGVDFYPVNLERVGAETEDDMDFHQDLVCGGEVEEPSDIMEAASMLEDLSEVDPFFCAVLPFEPWDEFHYKDLRIRSTCKRCGHNTREEKPEWEEERNYLKENFLLPSKYVPDLDVFKSHVFTSGWIVRPDVYEKLSKECDLRNCEANTIEVVERN